MPLQMGWLCVWRSLYFPLAKEQQQLFRTSLVTAPKKMWTSGLLPRGRMDGRGQREEGWNKGLKVSGRNNKRLSHHPRTNSEGPKIARWFSGQSCHLLLLFSSFFSPSFLLPLLLLFLSDSTQTAAVTQIQSSNRCGEKKGTIVPLSFKI